MKNWHMVSVLAIICGILLTATILTMINTEYKPSTTTMPQHYTYKIIQTYPHDKHAFTQGLTYADGVLYEGTGLYGSSTLRKVNLETGQVLEYVTLSSKFFGEGITLVEDKIVQLTWRSKVAFVYDKNSLSLDGNFTYATEGWGITFNGTCLIMSDGTDTLYFLDPENYKEIGHIKIQDGNSSVMYLNELEYVNGDVYANIWMNHNIVVIDTKTGQVKAWIDLTGLENPSFLNGEAMLNGIAYDSEKKRLFVTGKNWPNLYEIELVPLE